MGDVRSRELKMLGVVGDAGLPYKLRQAAVQELKSVQTGTMKVVDECENISDGQPPVVISCTYKSAPVYGYAAASDYPDAFVVQNASSYIFSQGVTPVVNAAKRLAANGAYFKAQLEKIKGVKLDCSLETLPRSNDIGLVCSDSKPEPVETNVDRHKMWWGSKI